MAHKRIANAVLFFCVGLAPTVTFAPPVPTANNGVDGSLRDESQALDGPQVKKALIATITSS